MNQELILVNDKDEEIGFLEKMQVHQLGLKHRAFSIFIFNNHNHLLIQQRASFKYHSGNLWANTCCGHPLKNENTKEAAEKRLYEEFGFTCDLKHIFSFSYHEKVDSLLIENEFDHVYIGFSNQIPYPNTTEVQDYTYITLEKLKEEITHFPQKYASWFKIIIQNHFSKIKNAIK